MLVSVRGLYCAIWCLLISVTCCAPLGDDSSIDVSPRHSSVPSHASQAAAFKAFGIDQAPTRSLSLAATSPAPSPPPPSVMTYWLGPSGVGNDTRDCHTRETACLSLDAVLSEAQDLPGNPVIQVMLRPGHYTDAPRGTIRNLKLSLEAEDRSYGATIVEPSAGLAYVLMASYNLTGLTLRGDAMVKVFASGFGHEDIWIVNCTAENVKNSLLSTSAGHAYLVNVTIRDSILTQAPALNLGSPSIIDNCVFRNLTVRRPCYLTENYECPLFEISQSSFKIMKTIVEDSQAGIVMNIVAASPLVLEDSRFDGNRIFSDAETLAKSAVLRLERSYGTVNRISLTNNHGATDDLSVPGVRRGNVVDLTYSYFNLTNLEVHNNYYIQSALALNPNVDTFDRPGSFAIFESTFSHNAMELCTLLVNFNQGLDQYAILEDTWFRENNSTSIDGVGGIMIYDASTPHGFQMLRGGAVRNTGFTTGALNIRPIGSSQTLKASFSNVLFEKNRASGRTSQLGANRFRLSDYTVRPGAFLFTDCVFNTYLKPGTAGSSASDSEGHASMVIELFAAPEFQNCIFNTTAGDKVFRAFDIIILKDGAEPFFNFCNFTFTGGRVTSVHDTRLPAGIIQGVGYSKARIANSYIQYEAAQTNGMCFLSLQQEASAYFEGSFVRHGMGFGFASAIQGGTLLVRNVSFVAEDADAVLFSSTIPPALIGTNFGEGGMTMVDSTVTGKFSNAAGGIVSFDAFDKIFLNQNIYVNNTLFHDIEYRPGSAFPIEFDGYLFRPLAPTHHLYIHNCKFVRLLNAGILTTQTNTLVSVTSSYAYDMGVNRPLPNDLALGMSLNENTTVHVDDFAICNHATRELTLYCAPGAKLIGTASLQGGNITCPGLNITGSPVIPLDKHDGSFLVCKHAQTTYHFDVTPSTVVMQVDVNCLLSKVVCDLVKESVFVSLIGPTKDVLVFRPLIAASFEVNFTDPRFIAGQYNLSIMGSPIDIELSLETRTRQASLYMPTSIATLTNPLLNMKNVALRSRPVSVSLLVRDERNRNLQFSQGVPLDEMSLTLDPTGVVVNATSIEVAEDGSGLLYNFVIDSTRSGTTRCLFEYGGTPGQHNLLEFYTFWEGWVYIATALLSLLLLAFLVRFCAFPLYKRLRAFVKQHREMKEELEVQMRLLEDYQRQGPASIQHQWLLDHEHTHSPSVFHIDSNHQLHVLCECPGHWHSVPESVGLPVSSATRAKLSPYVMALRQVIEEAENSSDDNKNTRIDISEEDDAGEEEEVAASALEWSDGLGPDSGEAPDNVYVSSYLRGLQSGGTYFLQQSWPGLVHVELPSGQTAWMCRRHMKEQEPNLVRPFTFMPGIQRRLDSASRTQASQALDSVELDVKRDGPFPLGTPEREIIDLVQNALSQRSSADVTFHLTRVIMYRNEAIEDAFRARFRTLAIEGRSSLRRPWPDSYSDARAEILRRENEWLKLWRHDPSTDNLTNLDLLWHGSSQGVAENIARLGFLNLASLNTGWYGRGAYLTHSAPYAEYYASQNNTKSNHINHRGEHVLVLCWALLGQVYPVVERMDRVTDPEHKFHGGYPGHDSHYAIVRRGGVVIADDIFERARETLDDEVAIWQENQLLPRFAVYYRVERHEQFQH